MAVAEPRVRDSWDHSGSIRFFGVDYDLRGLDEPGLLEIEAKVQDEVGKLRLKLSDIDTEKDFVGMEDEYAGKERRRRIVYALHIRKQQARCIGIEWSRRRNNIPPLGSFIVAAIDLAVVEGWLTEETAADIRMRAELLQELHMRDILSVSKSRPKSKVYKSQACDGKIPHDRKDEALAHLKSLGEVSDDFMTVYQCPWCTKWHVGHRKPKKDPTTGIETADLDIELAEVPHGDGS